MGIPCEDEISSKKWSFIFHIGLVILIGIAVAIIGGFSAKAAGDMSKITNFDKLKNSKDPAYSKTLDESHGYMAGAASASWVGFAALVVTIIIVIYFIYGSISVKLATGNIQPGSNCQEFVDSNARMYELIIMFVDLGITAFALFATSLAVRSFLSLRKFKETSISGQDKVNIDSAYKNSMITMGVGVGAGLIGILGLFY